MQLVFFASSFCEPCIQTRAVLDQASKLVPALKIAELDVARDTAEAERAGIRPPRSSFSTEKGQRSFAPRGYRASIRCSSRSRRRSDEPPTVSLKRFPPL
jgi:thiol-disulfide isomerase/thioredoxin